MTTPTDGTESTAPPTEMANRVAAMQATLADQPEMDVPQFRKVPKGGRKFRIGDHEYWTKEQVGAEEYSDFLDDVSSELKDDAVTSHKGSLEKCRRSVVRLCRADSAEEILLRLQPGAEDPIGLVEINEVVAWLAGAVTGRPTTPASPSTGPLPETGGTSTAGAPLVG